MSVSGRQLLIKSTHKEVIPGHTGLPGNTSGNDNDISTLEGLLSSIVGREETGDLGRGSDVRQIGGHLTYKRLAGLASPRRLACFKAK